MLLILGLALGCGAGDSAPSARQSLNRAGEFDQETVIREVRARFDGLVASARSLEVDAYLGFFDRSTFSALNADGSVVASLEPFAEAYGASLESVERYLNLDFTEVHIQAVSADLAILVNEYVASVQLTNGEVVPAAGGGTQVWSKSSGEWLLVNVSSSSAS